MKKTGYFLLDRRCASVTINLNGAVSSCDLRRQAKTGSTERYCIGVYVLPTHVSPTPVIACKRVAGAISVYDVKLFGMVRLWKKDSINPD